MHKYIFWYRTILLLEKNWVFTQPYFNQHLFLERERRSYFFFCIRDWKLLEEGVFTQPYSIYYSFFFFLHYESTVGTEVLHYDNKKQRGNGKHRVDFLSIRCFCLKEGFFFLQPYFISAHLWYHTMFLLEEGVFLQPYSISYGITLWLKKNEQTLTHFTY